MSTSNHDAIENLLRENRVVLFMKGNRAQPQCGFSAKTVAALDMLLPEYLAIDVLQNPEIREGIKTYGNWPTIPQLYVDGELVGGSDIVTEMFDAGELGSVLGLTEPVGKPPHIEIDAAATGIMVGAAQVDQIPSFI
ncbi:MAG: Grx4 family monothiol glutaredoxin [Gammaproteobacteria bacterium]